LGTFDRLAFLRQHTCVTVRSARESELHFCETLPSTAPAWRVLAMEHISSNGISMTKW
jgi:hypothetical protein